MAGGGANGSVAADAFRERAQKQLKEALVARDGEDVEPLRVAVERAAEAGLATEGIDAARQVLEKLEAEHRPLAFTDVPRPEMECLQACGSREKAIQLLMDCMGLSVDTGLQAEILAEFHYHNFMFCQKQRFCPEKASAFLSIMKMLHDRAMVQESLPEEKARALFESLIRRHSQQLPPFSVGALSPEDTLAAKEFASRSFFRHYSMYAYAYSQQQDLSVCALSKTVAPQVAEVAALHKCFELDPREVPELADLFVDAEAEAPAERAHIAASAAASAAAVAAATTAGGGGPSSSSSPSAVDGRKAEVHAAVDEAMKVHLGGLDSRLQHPLSE